MDGPATKTVLKVVDTRTLRELAKEAIDIQDACNVSALVFGWARCMERFNELFHKCDGDFRNTHPINVMWSDKLASLTGAQYGGLYAEKYAECQKLAGVE